MILLDHPLVDIDRIDELAGKATPGPWVLLCHAESGNTQEICAPGHTTNGTDKIVDCLWGSAVDRGRNDYAYIAALDPQTLLALAKVVRAAKALCEAWPSFGVADPAAVALRDSLKAVRAV